MPRTSSTPCKVPSSPGRPCSTLSATSGLRACSLVEISRLTSMRLTRKPIRSSASAQALPERNDTSRSADHPPMRTATCFILSAIQTDSFDLPFQIDAGMRLHPLPHGFAQRFDVGRAGAAKIYEKVAVELGNLRPTDGESAAAGFVHQLPGTVSRRIFEGRAASSITRLTRFALFLDLRHFGGNLVGLAGPPLQRRARENHIIGHTAMTV